MILRRNIIKKVKFRNIQKHEDYIFKCEIFKKNKNLFAKKFNKYTRILQNFKKSRIRDKLKSIYYLWKYNKKFNKFSFLIIFIYIFNLNKFNKEIWFKMGV